MNEQLSRRTALLTIGGATAVAAVPVAAIASSPSVDRSAWDQAFAAYEQAKADDAAYNDVYEALYEQCQQAEQAIPHVILRPDPHTGPKPRRVRIIIESEAQPVITERRRSTVLHVRQHPFVASGIGRIVRFSQLICV